MEICTLSHEEVLSLVPDRAQDSHKGDYGRILLLCGSRGYTGAAALAAMGALRSGAGLVYLGVPESIYAIEAMKLLEPVVFPLPEEDGKLSLSAAEKIRQMLPNMDAVLFGPGCGRSNGGEQLLQLLLKECACPLILDADGINMLCAHMDILRGRPYPTILTPHAGEFARICDRITGNRIEDATRFARENRCILLLKGHKTVITDGQTLYVNPTGNPGMAVGGSGDVLAGIITALVGQQLQPLTAAACGAWLHGKAGDICAARIGQYGMLPSDMLEVLPRLMK